ncbi:hypothetical protein GOV13_03435 [Candidatus Pacearchaeota archaeon]|nr:hypothetical protein [Candidatus Pacearchaeota archaeon]
MITHSEMEKVVNFVGENSGIYSLLDLTRIIPGSISGLNPAETRRIVNSAENQRKVYRGRNKNYYLRIKGERRQ